MASLVVCTACRRHVRSREPKCPFCGAERKPTAGVSREGLLARDATRATLIALGLTLAGQACGGDAESNEDRDQVGIVPPYGLIPIPDGDGGSGGGGGGRDSEGEGGSELTVPPYGAMPHPTPDQGGSGGADAPDSGTPPDAGEGDASTDDAGTDASGTEPPT